MNRIISSINKIFKSVLNWQNKKGIKLRNRDISISDIIKYGLLYSQINKTKIDVVSHINFENNHKSNRTSFYRKERNCSIELYKTILNKLRKFYNEEYNNNNKISIMSVDGTFNNSSNSKEKIVTNLNMGYYDIEKDIPIDLQFIGQGKKNTELKQLKEYIEKNQLKNIIIIADRAYFKYELFDFLNSKKIYYVIRIKNNSLLLKNESINVNNKNKKLMEDLKNNSRIIKCQSKSQKELVNKRNKKIRIETKSEYNLLTNLKNTKEYSDDKIKEIYRSRWNIELFFKLLKSKFKFSYLTEKTELQYKKTIILDLIMIYLSRILKRYVLNNTKKVPQIIKRKTHKHIDVKININESNLINGIYTELLDHIVVGSLYKKLLTKFLDMYIEIIKNEPNRHFPRICKCPFKKWYIKLYHEMYKYWKILKKIAEGSQESLHKNLKLKLKNTTITIL